MISLYLLLNDVRNHLKTAFSGFKFREPVNNGNPLTTDGTEKYREPRFYIEALPAKRTGTTPDSEEQGEDVPYVLVKPLDADTTGTSSRRFTIKIGIVYCIYDADGTPETGIHDAMNMHDRILESLITRQYWADNYFCQELPVKSVFGIGKGADVYDSRWQTGGPYRGGVVMTQFYANATPFFAQPGTVDACEPGCEHI